MSLSRLGSLSFVLLMMCSLVIAQSGQTTMGTPGTPNGSYKIGDADTVNLFNGNLNYQLPLLEVGGRGDARTTLGLSLEGHVDYREVPMPAGFEGYVEHQYSYRAPNPLALVGQLKLEVATIPTDEICVGLIKYVEHRVNMVYVERDGTEHALRDTNTHGVNYVECGIGSRNIGRLFESTGGNFVTFVADADINTSCSIACESVLDGYLYFPNGTKSRVVDGLIRWTQDRNGNKLEYEYETTFQHRLTKVTDSLNRVVDIEYDVVESPYGRHDRWEYKGVGGEDKVIRIIKGQVLRNTQPWDSIREPFELDEPNDQILIQGGSSDSIDYVKTVLLPNGKTYNFQYNIFGQLARVELPTGGAIEYDYRDLFGIPFVSQLSENGPLTNQVSEKRVYGANGVLESRTKFTNPTTYTTGVVSPATRGGVVRDVTLEDPNGTLMSKSRHYFYGAPNNKYGLLVPWWHGKELRAETFASDGQTILRVNETVWRQRTPNWCNSYPPCIPNPSEQSPTNNPFVVETKTTLTDGNLVSKVTAGDPNNSSTWAFDAFNNQTDRWVYGFGVGQTGALLQHTQTTYANTATPMSGVYLLGLVTATNVYAVDSQSQETLASASETIYDEYTTYPLLTCPDVIGWQEPGNLRGNPTTVRRWLNTNSSWIATHAQFDVVGNTRRNWDALNRLTETSYDDAYSDGVDRKTYAFVTQTKTPIPDTSNIHGANTEFISSVTFDYRTGLAITATNANGQTTTFEYNDPLNRLKKITRPAGGGWTSYDYSDDPGNLYVKTTAAIDATQSVPSYAFFDALGRSVRTFAAKGGGVWTINDKQYDAAGRVRAISKPYEATVAESVLNTATINPANNWVTTGYDTLDRVVSVTSADSSAMHNNYDGNTVTVIDPTQRKRKSVSDALGRLVQVVEDPGGPKEAITDYKYDILGNLRMVTQGGQQRYYMYDSLSRLIRSYNPEETVNPDLATTADPISNNTAWSNKTVYLANGSIESETDARGVRTDYQYDNLNRVHHRSYTTTRTLPAGTFSATSAVDVYYDGRGLGLTTIAPTFLGKMVRVSSTIGETRYTSFDSMGRIVSSEQRVDGQTYTMPLYSYNLAGAVTSETYPSGRVVLQSYDEVGKLTGVSGQNPNQSAKTYASNFDYSFTNAGGTSKVQLGNGRWEHTEYNKRLQPTLVALGATATGAEFLKLEYDYGTGNNNGNILSQTITVPAAGSSPAFTATQSYGYDSLNRLNSAVETTGAQTNWKQSFSFDRFGNRSVLTSANDTTPALVGDNPQVSTTNNRIVAQSGEFYQYDDTGNLVKDRSGNTYSYDANNLQESFTSVGTTTIAAQYFYDGEGRRVKKVVGNNTTVFVYDCFGKLVAEYEAAPPPVTSPTTYLTADNLGTPRVTTDAQGNVQARHDYLPFGEELGAFGGRATHAQYQPDTVRQKFTGYQHDSENNLDFAQSRYYASAAGRFTSVDPLMASASTSNPSTFNRYTYVLNNPYRYTDPTGMVFDEDYDLAFAAHDHFLERVAAQAAADAALEEAKKKEEEQRAQEQQTNQQNNQQGNAPEQPDVQGENTETSATPVAAPDYGEPVEIIIWGGTTNGGKDPSSAFGHVSYVISGRAYSWEMYRNPDTGKEEWRKVNDVEYSNERRQLSAGRGYTLDLGSPERNQQFANAIINAYNGTGGYNLIRNNCGHAFQRAVNEMKLSETPNKAIRPSQHERYINQQLSGYIIRRYNYSKGGSIN